MGRVLSQRRHELGLTQEELADLSGVSLRLVHELEHNKVSVRLDNLLRVINALGFHLELHRGATHGIVTRSKQGVRFEYEADWVNKHEQAIATPSSPSCWP